ncbi:MAG: tRNA (N(6)-L-threonylcarbamoyladenosine(37)-C(2))-methylthiotransferase MtaB [Bacteroidales bacterium]|nr:tRNA (N(6)-L-threonylcarbamoyladenosine(37)-C(2))-methylthiotransferase MtaB [Bacteroidales bacterium]MCM1414785.1 tRNA (N(6)-L-threonylcarbamoyladenosine(37)-C(2))-methylthiotransferase MtaB [bacterium]MCM1423209.1 tRNA (N(6)-L-threonylcarbamoyladenosine(37)-C(2))-methylthiotransferase MtaB [bacterium]
MKSVALHNLGCKVNAYELDFMQQMLQEKGYKIVPFDEKADVYIVNTCTVTNIADRKSRQMLHRARKRNPDAVVVAVGCYVQTGQESLIADGTVDLAIGNNKKGELAQILEEYLAGQDTRIHTIDIAQAAEYEELSLRETSGHTRAFLKIQDGCNQFCTYCIIPYARGRIRSRRQENVLAEAARLAAAGYRELVLTGIHLSSYGMDRGGSELLPLLGGLSKIPGVERIRLGSLEPGIVTEAFAESLSALPKVCPHFHLSLQSGSDAVLRRMNRKYDTAAYLEAVARLRNHYENPAVTTDVIVGFPGETEAEFQETEDFLARVGFYEMHIFKYSRRQGTPAADMPEQLTEAEKAARSERLVKLERDLSRAYRAAFLGKAEPVLFEEVMEREDGSWWIGHTPHYVRAACRAKEGESLQNRIIPCRLVSFWEEDVLLAEKTILS